MTTKQPRRPRTATAHRPASTGPTPAGPTASDMAFGAGLGAEGPVVGPEPGFGEAGFGEPAASGLELAVTAILDAAAPPMDPRPDDVAQQLVRTFSGWYDLEERAAAWHDLGFWTGPRWDRAGVDGLALRPHADPIVAALERLQGAPADTRFGWLVQWHDVEGLGPRLREGRRLPALMEGLDAADRLRMHWVLGRGELPPEDPALWLRASLEAGDLEQVEAALTESLSMEAAEALAADRVLVRDLRHAAPALAEALERRVHGALGGAEAHPGAGALSDPDCVGPDGAVATDAAPSDRGYLGTVEPDIAATVDALAGLVAGLGGWWADEPGEAALRILTRARGRFLEAAEAWGDPVLARHLIRQASQAVDTRLEGRGVSVLSLLDAIADFATRRKVARLLGREALRTGTERVDPDGQDDPRLQVLLEEAVALGARLAEAVGAGDASRIQAHAEHADRAWNAAASRGVLDFQDRSPFTNALEAGFEPLGGPLPQAIEKLEGATDLAERLGYASLAVALKASDDTRPNAVVEAEYALKRLVGEFFKSVVSENAEVVVDFATPDASNHLLTPARALIDASPDHEGPASALIQATYAERFGIALGDHLDRSALPTRVKATVREGLELGAGAGAVPQDTRDAPDLHQLTPEFFELHGDPIPGTQVEKPRTPRTEAQVDIAVAAHLAYLEELLGDLGGWTLYDPEAKLTAHLSKLAFSGGKALVLDAWRAAHGHELRFALEEARTQGTLGEDAASTGLRLAGDDGLSKDAQELLGEATAGNWDGVLVTVNSKGFGASRRTAILDDADTMARLRALAPDDRAWDLFRRSLTGEVDEAEFLDDDGGLWDAVEEWIPYVDEYEADADKILAARDGRLGEEERDRARALRVTDVDVQHRLDGSHGGRFTDWFGQLTAWGIGSDDSRMKREYELLDRKDQGVRIAEADDAFGGRGGLRDGLAKLKDDDRKALRQDASFRQFLEERAGGEAGILGELFGLLDGGKDDLEAGLADADASGVDWFADPWRAVDVLSKQPEDELARIAVDPAQRSRFEAAVEGTPKAAAELATLLDAAEASVRAVDAPQDSAAAAPSIDPVGPPSDPEAQVRYRARERLEPAADGPKARAERALYVARHRSAILAALERDDKPGLMEALLALGADRREKEHPESATYAVSGFRFRDAVAELDEAVRTRLDAATPFWKTERLVAAYDGAKWGDDGIATILLTEIGVDDEKTALAIVDAVSEDTLARRWASIRMPARDGTPPLASVYGPFRAARQKRDDARKALEKKAAALNGVPEAERAAQLTEARAAYEAAEARHAELAPQLAHHRVDLTEEAAEVLTRTGFVDGEDSESAVFRKVRARLRKRIGALEAETVRKLVGGDAVDDEILWGPARKTGLVVAELADTADVSVGETSWGFEALATSDNTGALHLAAFAHQLDGMDYSRLDEAGLKRLESLQGDAMASLEAYQKARATAAELASFAATLAATALAAAVTGPGAAPLAAQLIATASAGLASLAVKELIQGSSHDAEAGVQKLAVDLLVEAATAGLGDALKGARVASARWLQQGNVGAFLGTVQGSVDTVLRVPGAKAGVAVLQAAAAVPTKHISEAAWVGVEEALVGDGLDDGLRKGLLAFEAKVGGMPDELAHAILEALAKEVGKAAVAKPAGGPDMSAPKRSDGPGGLVGHLGKGLGDLGTSTLRKGGESAIAEGLSLAGREAWHRITTGELDITEEDVTASLLAVGKATSKHAVTGLGTAVGDARKKVRADHRKTTAEAWVQEAAADADEAQRKAFVAWYAKQGGRVKPHRDLSSDEGTVSGAERDAFAMERAWSRFQAEVWEPARRRLEAERVRHGDIERDDPTWQAYEGWVIGGKDKARDRVDRLGFDAFARRHAKARASRDALRTSERYRALAEAERAWLDRALADDKVLGDLSTETPTLPVRLDSDEDVRTVRRAIRGASKSQALKWARDYIQTVEAGPRRDFLLRRAPWVAESVGIVTPGSEADQQQVIEILDVEWSAKVRLEQLYGIDPEPPRQRAAQ